jgi:hypothetical protein
MNAKTPTAMSQASRATAAHMANDQAKRLERRAKALRVLADLVDEHLETNSEEESLIWELVCSIPQR